MNAIGRRGASCALERPTGHDTLEDLKLMVIATVFREIINTVIGPAISAHTLGGSS